MSENTKQPYDFNYLCRALNLLPCPGGAFSPSAIVTVDVDSTGAEFVLRDGRVIGFTPDDLAEIENAIKERIKESQEAQAEEIKRQSELRIQSELNAANAAMANAAMMGKLKGLKRNS